MGGGEQTGLLIDIPVGLNGNVTQAQKKREKKKKKQKRLHPWVLSYSQG